jgi:ABC-2 type transport system ATP-binding protein
VTAGAAAEAAIEVRGLVKRYDGRAVVDDLSFSVGRGEIFALLGPNGAGKTTTVEILEGYRQADDGDVRVLGLDPERDAAALRARIGLMLQAGGVYPQVTPLEILHHYGRFHERPNDPDGLLSLVGLGDARRTRYRVLSGGQKQRLALALALVGRPQLVVLDEPTAGMDPAAKVATRDLIGRLRTSGVTVLLTTHDLADVERLADTVAIVVRGSLVAFGSPAALTAGGTARLRFRLDGPLAAADRTALAERLLGDAVPADGAALVDEGGGRYRLDGRAPNPDIVARLAAWSAERGTSIVEVRTSGATLEERYLELVAAADASADPSTAADPSAVAGEADGASGMGGPAA